MPIFKFIIFSYLLISAAALNLGTGGIKLPVPTQGAGNGDLTKELLTGAISTNPIDAATGVEPCIVDLTSYPLPIQGTDGVQVVVASAYNTVNDVAQVVQQAV